MSARLRYLAHRVLLLAALLCGLSSLTGLTQAHAATTSPGMRMLAWAQAHATGNWYGWGGTGPAVYDCSGIVFRAALNTGVTGIPRTTYEMLASRKLVRTYHPVAGDLAFFGSGHVEFVTDGHDVTFGALTTGTRVGYHTWNTWWQPSAFYRIT